MTKRDETRGQQKPEHPHSDASCVTASCMGAGAVFEMAGDGKWTGVPKTKRGGCRSPNARIVVFCARCSVFRA